MELTFKLEHEEITNGDLIRLWIATNGKDYRYICTVDSSDEYALRDLADLVSNLYELGYKRDWMCE